MFSIKLLDVKTGNVERQLAKNIPKIDLIVEIKSMALSFIKLEIIEQHDSEGGFYKGYLNNNERNGMGTYEYPANDKYKRDKYVGEWRNDVRHGEGTLYWVNGNRYKGNFTNDCIEGKGTFYWESGGDIDKYEGDWANGKKHGYGKLCYSNGDYYEGHWKDDKMDGKRRLLLQ